MHAITLVVLAERLLKLRKLEQASKMASTALRAMTPQHQLTHRMLWVKVLCALGMGNHVLALSGLEAAMATTPAEKQGVARAFKLRVLSAVRKHQRIVDMPISTNQQMVTSSQQMVTSAPTPVVA